MTRLRLWFGRSRPHQVFGSIAVALLLASVVIGQVDGLLERNKLRSELDCRSRIAGQVADSEAVVVISTGRGLVALVNDDDAELARQADIIRRSSDRLDRARGARLLAEEVCRR